MKRYDKIQAGHKSLLEKKKTNRNMSQVNQGRLIQGQFGQTNSQKYPASDLKQVLL